MTQTETKNIEALQQQLDSAQQESHDTRVYLNHSNEEARLYRGLFWILLTVAAVLALWSVLNG